MPAVERQEREQVDDRQREADERDQRQRLGARRRRSLLRHVVAADDAVRSACAAAASKIWPSDPTVAGRDVPHLARGVAPAAAGGDCPTDVGPVAEAEPRSLGLLRRRRALRERCSTWPSRSIFRSTGCCGLAAVGRGWPAHLCCFDQVDEVGCPRLLGQIREALAVDRRQLVAGLEVRRGRRARLHRPDLAVELASGSAETAKRITKAITRFTPGPRRSPRSASRPAGCSRRAGRRRSARGPLRLAEARTVLVSRAASSSGFIPVIFTKPPSGIAPIPYSVSPRLMLTIFGGKNRKKRSTRIPTAFAAVKCPTSWRMISEPRSPRARRGSSSRRHPRPLDQLAGALAGLGVDGVEVLEVRRAGRPECASSVCSTTSAIAVNGMRPSRKALDRDLVGRVQHARRGAAGLPGLAGQAQAGEGLRVGLLEGRARRPRRGRAPGTSTSARSG